MVGGKHLSWRNMFEDEQSPQLVSGRHITLPSVLQETTAWRDDHSGCFEFVDPEIGNLAAGVASGGASFSYLHIVSDNLSRNYTHDLSNERDAVVLARRADAYSELGGMIRKMRSRQD